MTNIHDLEEFSFFFLYPYERIQEQNGNNGDIPCICHAHGIKAGHHPSPLNGVGWKCLDAIGRRRAGSILDWFD